MNIVGWGRIKNNNNARTLKSFTITLFIGCIAVSIIIFGGFTQKTEILSASASITGDTTEQYTNGEPFGYFAGKWSLWEFIGDLVSSIL